MEKTKNKKSYTGVIIALCFLMIFVCLGFCSSNRSLYLAPVTEALGIKRSAFSVGDSIRFIVTSVVNMFFGTLVVKFGTKKLIIAGFICLILSSCICSFASKLIWFYIAGALLGIGFSWTGTTMVAFIINMWCKEKKGTIMGAVLAANGVGAAVAAQLLSPIIYKEGDLFGYRNAYLITASIVGITLILFLFFYKEKQGNFSIEDDKINGVVRNANENERDGIDISVTKKKIGFYVVLICLFLTGMALQGVVGVAAAHMKDVGLAVGYVTTIIGVYSLTLTASKFMVGFMYDKFGLKVTASLCYTAAVVAMTVLACLSKSPELAVVYAFAAAIAMPLETVMLPLFANGLFGSKSYEQVLGIFTSVNTAGYAFGIPFMNGVFDIVGSYRPAFVFFAIVMCLNLFVFRAVVNISKK